MDKLNKIFHTPFWLFVILVIVFVVRIPSLFEPYSYGDEMIYLTLGNGVRENMTLYKDLHDNKPPLLYLTAAAAGNLFWFRAILLIWSLVTIYIFWKFSDRVFKKNKLGTLLSTFIFSALTTLPFLEGNISNSEMFMLGPTILAFYILLYKKPDTFNIFLAGLMLSVATLFKVPASFDLPAILLFWVFFVKNKPKSFSSLLKRTSILLCGFLLPIAISMIWYYFKGAFGQYLIAAFLQNIGYLSNWRSGDVQESFLARNAPLLARVFIVLIFTAILYFKRNKLDKIFTFICLWLLMSSFAVTLSERPYPHYLIQLVPGVSLMFAYLFSSPKMEQVYAIFPLTLVFLIPVYYNFWYYKSAPYFVNFYKFVKSDLSKDQYFAYFDKNANRNYKIAQEIVNSTKKTDHVFVWGDNATIYALSKRLPPIKYVADYHIDDFYTKEEVVENFQVSPPKMIVVLPEGKEFQGLSSFISSNYFQFKEIDGVLLYLKINNQN
jgi:hypothetical protein